MAASRTCTKPSHPHTATVECKTYENLIFLQSYEKKRKSYGDSWDVYLETDII